MSRGRSEAGDWLRACRKGVEVVKEGWRAGEGMQCKEFKPQHVANANHFEPPKH